MVNERIDEGGLGPGVVIGLTQRSARRREYDLQVRDQTIGWLRWQPGRRSVAQAEGEGLGGIELTARRGRVVVTIGATSPGQDAGEVVATVLPERGGSVIHAVQGRPLRWRRSGRGNRWAIREGDVTLLDFAASQRLLKSSVRITVERAMPQETAVLLCLIGGFLALKSLQASIDGSAAVGAIVAGAG